MRNLRLNGWQALFSLALLMLAAGSGHAQPKNDAASFDVYAVTANGELISFKPNSPGKVRSSVQVTGLQMGETLFGIDFRSANGMLYGLGSTSRLYVIAPNGAATAVGGQFSTPLQGTDFGFDFNPTVDRIRVVSNTGQNLRINPDTGAVIVDGTLNSGGMTVPGITGAAYTNPDVDPNTGTTLYDIDSNMDMLVIQSNPNAGTLTPVGPLGFDAGNVAGFDIGLNFGTAAYFGLAAIESGNRTNLYSIDLATGQSVDLGTIGSGGALRGFAVNLRSSDRGIED